MKYFVFTLIILFLVSGCAHKQIEYVTQIKEVEKYVPVYPTVPDIQCDFYKDTPEEVLNSLLECVIVQKKFIESLKKTQ